MEKKEEKTTSFLGKYNPRHTFDKPHPKRLYNAGSAVRFGPQTGSP